MAKSVSVITPCYNYAQYLREALLSVCNQTVRADEIIVVSDGAVDNSVEVAKVVQQERPDQNIIIVEKQNGGLASARNYGAKMATSDYLISFDSDDIMRPQCIEKHLELAAENTIVTCGLMAFGIESYTARPKIASYELLCKQNVIYSNSLFPKALWEKVGGFDESETMRLGLEDWLFWIECAKSGAKFVTNDYVGLLWRRHADAMSNATANPNWGKITAYMKKKLKL